MILRETLGAHMMFDKNDSYNYLNSALGSAIISEYISISKPSFLTSTSIFLFRLLPILDLCLDSIARKAEKPGFSLRHAWDLVALTI